MLITEEYMDVLLKTREKIGEGEKKWGDTGHLHAEKIIPCLKREQYKDVLDYGSGHGTLAEAMRSHGYEVTEYDPGFVDKKDNNVPRSFVTCIDVLEHIEPDLLDNVLDDLQRCMLDKGYFVICCKRASKILSDGRNAHLIVEPPEWWKQKLNTRFNIISESFEKPTFSVYLSTKKK